MAVLVIGALSFEQNAGAAEEKGFRLVPVPKREHGYSGLKSQVIGSQKELDGLLKKVQAGGGWNERAKFLAAIKEAKIDFPREALVLLLHTEGSGSTQVTLADPKLRNGTLRCEITQKSAGMGTADMAYYCFAVAVKKTAAKKIELRVAGRKPVVMAVGG